MLRDGIYPYSCGEANVAMLVDAVDGISSMVFL